MSCLAAVTRLMEKQEGVDEASFDAKTAEVRVRHDPKALPPERILEMVRAKGHKAVLGAGAGSFLPASDFPPGLDVLWLTKSGEAVDYEAHLAPGKVTVVDFFAEWCGPCRKVDAAMTELLTGHTDLAYRKLDIQSWESEAARKHLAGISNLPYVLVYDAKGTRVDAITGLDLERLRHAIERARAVAP